MLPFTLSCIKFDWIWRLLLNSTQLWKIFLHYVQCFPVVRSRRFSNAVGLPKIIVFKQIVSQCSFMTCYGAPANTLSGFWPKQESQISLPALLQSHRLPQVLHAGRELNWGSWGPKRNLELLQLLLQFIVPLGWLFLLNRKLLFHQENISLKTLQRVSCSLNRSWGTDFLFQKLDINFQDESSTIQQTFPLNLTMRSKFAWPQSALLAVLWLVVVLSKISHVVLDFERDRTSHPPDIAAGKEDAYVAFFFWGFAAWIDFNFEDRFIDYICPK